MSGVFQPAVPISGYGGWKILENTAARQQATFEKSPSLQSDIQYFYDNIGKATTPEALVSDRRLLSVALGAFGLDDEINKKAFIKKALESKTYDPSSFVNRMNEPRYQALAKAFGYGDGLGAFNVGRPVFQDNIVAKYKALEFERAVGDVDNDMRLAMNFKRQIGDIASGSKVDSIGWFQIMGQAPLRELVSTALGLPSSVAQLDIDKQKQIFEQKADQIFGSKSPAIFTDSSKVEDVIRRFFLMRQMQNGPTLSTPGAAAVTLLGGDLGSDATTNLLLSQA